MNEPSGAPGTAHEDERVLVMSFKAGEDGAYQAIYDRYSGRVTALCRRMLLSPEDAAEASQETFLRVYVALPRFNGRYQLGAWVSRIATNVCLDMLRARGRAPVPPMSPQDMESLQLEEPDASRDPEVCLLRNAEGHQVRDTLASLSPLHRAAIVLREFEGYSYAEIAGTLDMSEHQVKALLHRARGSFKRSWMTALSSILVPGRWWQRVKAVPSPPKSHALSGSAHHGQIGEVVASSANFISSCSAALQHCGQFMSEKVAPLFVATAVGVAGGVAVASAPSEAPRRDPVEVTVENSVLNERLVRRRAGKAPRDHAKRSEAVQDPEPDPGTVPAPAQSEAPPPAEGSQGQKPEKPAPQATPSPEPSAPFQAAIGFDRNGPVVARASSGHAVSLDCSSKHLSQRLVIEIGDGDTSYPGVVELSISDGNVQLGIFLTKDGGEYQYRAWGAQPVLTWTQESRFADLHIEGEYGSVSDSAPTGADLPYSGPFTGAIRLDCESESVVSETITLGQN